MDRNEENKVRESRLETFYLNNAINKKNNTDKHICTRHCHIMNSSLLIWPRYPNCLLSMLLALKFFYASNYSLVEPSQPLVPFSVLLRLLELIFSFYGNWYFFTYSYCIVMTDIYVYLCQGHARQTVVYHHAYVCLS